MVRLASSRSYGVCRKNPLQPQQRNPPCTGLRLVVVSAQFVKIDGKLPKYLTPAIVLFGVVILLLALIYPHSSKPQKYGTNNPIDWAACFDGYGGVKVIYTRRDRTLESSRCLDWLFASMNWRIRKQLIGVEPCYLNNMTNVLCVRASLTNSVSAPPEAWLVEPGG